MKKVNWKLIGTIIGAIGWLATVLYAWTEQQSRKYWEKQWEKELDEKIDYRSFARSFRSCWVLYKGSAGEYSKDRYSKSMDRLVEDLDKLYEPTE